MKDKPLRSYGRIKGRALKPRQARLLETLLPKIEIPAEGEIDLDALFPLPVRGGGRRWGEAPSSENLAKEQHDRLQSFPPPPDPLPSRGGGHALEIGFGGGEHLVAQAQAHPGWRFLGIEPFLNGVASCLRHIEETGVQNIRLRQGDARDVLARLPDASLDRIYILFPDPWPKKRHWKRRLIQPDFIAELARVLKSGGEARFATDWKHYAAWTLELFLKECRFAWLAERADDWQKPWAEHFPTRYEQKRLGNSASIFLRFIKE